MAIPRAQAAVVGYWRFENNLQDSSGNGYHATSGATGFGYTSDVPGAVVDPGHLANLASYERLNTGTAATTTVAYNASLTDVFSSGSFTVEAFVYLAPGGPDNFRTILSNRADGKGISLSVGKTFSGYISATNGAGTTSSLNYGGSLAVGQWYHVAWVGTYTPTGGSRGTAVRFYVDGLQVGSPAFYFAPQAGGEAMLMGDANWSIGGVSNNFNGWIDELRISDEALAPDAFLIASIPEPSMAWLMLGGLTIWLGYTASPLRRIRH